MRPAPPLIAALLLTCCACNGPDGPDPLEERIRAVYAGKDLPLVKAHLWKPPADAGPLAPLLVQQADESDDAAVPVMVATPDRRTFVWSYPGTGSRDVQGLRMTLGSDGFPLAYEVLHDSSGLRLIFVESSVEDAAAEQFGPPLPGRRFSVEPSLDHPPGVVVPALFEAGGDPLGAFVYLYAGSHDVDTILCRCQPSRVDEIVESADYRLAPRARDATDPWSDRDGPPLDSLLRWPSGL